MMSTYSKMREFETRVAAALVAVAMFAVLDAPASARSTTIKKRPTATAQNSKGVVARFSLGGSAPTSDEHDQLNAVGLRVGGTLGYQIPVMDRVSITPELWLNYMSWSGDRDVSTSMFVFAVGAQGDYFFLPDLSGWAGLHLGGGSVGSSPGDQSKGGFALAIDWGATYYFNEYVGAGAFFSVTNTFAGKDDTTGADFSAGAFDFGIQLRGRYAL